MKIKADAEKRIKALSLLAQSDRCKSDFFYFVKTFWSVIIPEKPVWNWHIRYLCKELERVGKGVANRTPKEYDLLINVPPATTKSTIITIMFPAWCWAIDPTLRIISNSYSGSISTEHAVKSRDIIQSKRYKALFPEVKIRKDKSGKQTYDNTKNGARYTTSTGGAITGKHAHIIINDDPQNPKQAESDAHRKQSVLHTKTLSSRTVDKSITVVITVMQRLNTEDVSGYLLKNKASGLKHIKLPSQLTTGTKPIPKDEYFEGKTLFQWYEHQKGMLDPIRLNSSAIDEAKIDLGSRGYNGQYLQNPTVEEGDIIKKDWFKVCTKAEFNSKRRLNSEPIDFFIDTAYTDNNDNDPTGILGVCRIGNTLYITSRLKVRKEFPKLIKFLPEWLIQNGYTDMSGVRIEPKANGLSVIQTLKSETNLNIMKTKAPTDSKKTRLNSVSPKIESGRVVLVEGLWNEPFIEEVCGFPNAPHDEDVDLISYAITELLSSDNELNITGEILW